MSVPDDTCLRSELSAPLGCVLADQFRLFKSCLAYTLKQSEGDHPKTETENLLCLTSVLL